MRRYLFTLFAALSTLLFIVAAAAWVRTFFVSDDVRLFKYRWTDSSCTVLQIRWAGDFAELHLVRTDNGHASGMPLSALAGDIVVRHKKSGASPQGVTSWLWWDHYVDHQSYATAESLRVQFRPWLPMVPFLLLPLAWLRRLVVARRKQREGLCPKCGYDLRATPARCPECGVVRE